MNQNWIQDEILRGLQKLLSLSLDRTPASELLPITVGTWVEALTNGREFDEGLDAFRLRKAFVTLAETRSAWPAPRDFIAAIPDRDQLALARESRKADPLRAAEACAEIARELSIDRKTAAAGPDA